MISDQTGDSYTGPFYLELQTEIVLRDTAVVTMLDELSTGIILNLERPDVTIWEFLDQGSAFKGVLMLEHRKLPFTLTGKNDLVFIEKS